MNIDGQDEDQAHRSGAVGSVRERSDNYRSQFFAPALVRTNPKIRSSPEKPNVHLEAGAAAIQQMVRRRNLRTLHLLISSQTNASRRNDDHVPARVDRRKFWQVLGRELRDCARSSGLRTEEDYARMIRWGIDPNIGQTLVESE